AGDDRNAGTSPASARHVAGGRDEQSTGNEPEAIISTTRARRAWIIRPADARPFGDRLSDVAHVAAGEVDALLAPPPLFLGPHLVEHFLQLRLQVRRRLGSGLSPCWSLRVHCTD